VLKSGANVGFGFGSMHSLTFFNARLGGDLSSGDMKAAPIPDIALALLHYC
jgi:hypothetical protein